MRSCICPGNTTHLCLILRESDDGMAGYGGMAIWHDEGRMRDRVDRLEDEADTRHDRLNFDTLLQYL